MTRKTSLSSAVRDPRRQAVAVIFLCTLTALLSGVAQAQDGVVNSTQNPLQVGLLQWNKQDQPTTFAAGGGPAGVAFDGASVWVANFGSNNVMKLRASDGALLGTFAAGTGPYGRAFDGANIWVANELSTLAVFSRPLWRFPFPTIRD